MTEHAVKLSSIPDGLEIPPELAQRVRYDAAAQRLLFRGFMYKADYDRLMGLHSSVEYRRAIEQLFQISTSPETPELRRFAHVLAGLAAGCLLLAAAVWWQLTSRTHENPRVLLPQNSTLSDRSSGLNDAAKQSIEQSAQNSTAQYRP
jgi:hypothetical protein